MLQTPQKSPRRLASVDLLPTPCKSDKSGDGFRPQRVVLSRFHASLHKDPDVVPKGSVNKNVGLVRVRVLQNPSRIKSNDKHGDEKSNEKPIKKDNNEKNGTSMELKTLRELAATSVKSPPRKLSKREVMHGWWKVR